MAGQHPPGSGTECHAACAFGGNRSGRRSRRERVGSLTPSRKGSGPTIRRHRCGGQPSGRDSRSRRQSRAPKRATKPSAISPNGVNCQTQAVQSDHQRLRNGAAQGSNQCPDRHQGRDRTPRYRIKYSSVRLLTSDAPRVGRWLTRRQCFSGVVPIREGAAGTPILQNGTSPSGFPARSAKVSGKSRTACRPQAETAALRRTP